MKLLTKELEGSFKKVGSQEDNSDPVVIAKYFHPFSNAKWYATEYYPEDRIFYGYVSLFNDHCDEWGDFSLDELETVKVMGLGIERDMCFISRPISEVLRKEGRYGYKG